MANYRVLLDGNGSGFIRVLGLGDYVPWPMWNQKLQECDALVAQIEKLKICVKEEAYNAYWEASDNHRADRWSDTFDNAVRAEFEKYWEERQKGGDV